MEIIFECLFCQQELTVDRADAGHQISCPTCSKTITIPMETPPRPARPKVKKTLRNPFAILYHLIVFNIMQRRGLQIRSRKAFRAFVFFPSGRTQESCHNIALRSQMKLVSSGFFQRRWYKVPDVFEALKTLGPVFAMRIGVSPHRKQIVFTGRKNDFPEFETFLSVHLSKATK
ncbi:MAG: hypothetical protein ABI042_10225 [Verrucomicrobiota bacterium]